eukprot:4680982-Alexandrium_andersonii.AAC.1
MSASLVGSEMCIRDRQVPQNAPLGSVGHQFRGLSWARAVPSSNARSEFASVSYTHLTLPTICSV